MPIKSTVLGPCKVIPQEQDNIALKLIDLDDKTVWAPLLIQHLYREAAGVMPTDFKED